MIKIVDDNGEVQCANFNMFIVLKGDVGHKIQKGTAEFESFSRVNCMIGSLSTGKVRRYILSPDDISTIDEHFRRIGVKKVTVHQAIRVLQNTSRDYFVEIVTNHRNSLSVSKGVLTMLANGVISEDIFKLTEDNVSTISLLIGISEDNDPGRTLRRYRKKAANFFTKLFDWIPSTKLVNDEMSLNEILYSEVAFHVDKALTNLMSLKDKFMNVTLLKHAKALKSLMVKPAREVIKHISNRICGHFFPQYCPQ